MSQERKLPVKEKAYSLLVRPIARIAMLVIFLAVVQAVGLYIGGGRVSADYIAVSTLLGAVIATVALAVSSMPEKGIERTRKKVLRAIVQYLLVVNVATLSVLILTTVSLALTGHLTMRPIIVCTLAPLFLCVIFLRRLRLLLSSTRETPKLIQKKGD